MSGRKVRVEEVLEVLERVPGRRSDLSDEALRQIASELMHWYLMGRLQEQRTRAYSAQRKRARADLEKLERLALRLSDHIATMDQNAALWLAGVDPEGTLHRAPLVAKMALTSLDEDTEGETLAASAPNKVRAQLLSNRAAVVWRQITGAAAVRSVRDGYEASPLVGFTNELFEVMGIQASAQSQVAVLRKKTSG